MTCWNDQLTVEGAPDVFVLSLSCCNAVHKHTKLIFYDFGNAADAAHAAAAVPHACIRKQNGTRQRELLYCPCTATRRLLGMVACVVLQTLFSLSAVQDISMIEVFCLAACMTIRV
jgi:hypothetical protein